MSFRKTKIYFLTVALGLGLAACSDDAKETVRNLKEAPNLQGTFSDACSSSKIADASEIIRLNFEGNTYTRTQIFYGEPGCAKEIGRVEYKGEFVVGDDVVDGENQGGNLNLSIQEAKVTVSSETLAKTLNVMNYCGHKDFAVGKDVAITGKQTAGLCPLENVPGKYFTTYRVEKEVLFLGSPDITTMSQNEATRGNKVIFEKPYKKD